MQEGGVLFCFEESKWAQKLVRIKVRLIILHGCLWRKDRKGCLKRDISHVWNANTVPCHTRNITSTEWVADSYFICIPTSMKTASDFHLMCEAFFFIDVYFNNLLVFSRGGDSIWCSFDSQLRARVKTWEMLKTEQSQLKLPRGWCGINTAIDRNPCLLWNEVQTPSLKHLGHLLH